MTSKNYQKFGLRLAIMVPKQVKILGNVSRIMTLMFQDYFALRNVVPINYHYYGSSLKNDSSALFGSKTS
jgi:hypothetical protein